MYSPDIVLRSWMVSHTTVTEDGSPLVTRATIWASRPLMVWTGSSGGRYLSDPVVVTSTLGGTCQGASPVTDQGGWRDQQGHLIDVSAEGSHTHMYRVRVTQFKDEGCTEPVGVPRTIGPFPLPTGDLSPVDIDQLIEAGIVEGHIVSVPDHWSELVAQAVAAAGSADAAAQSAEDAGDALAATKLLAVVATPSPEYPGTALRLTYLAHLSPAPHMVRLPIGAAT